MRRVLVNAGFANPLYRAVSWRAYPELDREREEHERDGYTSIRE